MNPFCSVRSCLQLPTEGGELNSDVTEQRVAKCMQMKCCQLLFLCFCGVSNPRNPRIPWKLQNFAHASALHDNFTGENPSGIWTLLNQNGIEFIQDQDQQRPIFLDIFQKEFLLCQAWRHSRQATICFPALSQRNWWIFPVRWLSCLTEPNSLTWMNCLRIASSGNPSQANKTTRLCLQDWW